jgi:hypothetical protein
VKKRRVTERAFDYTKSVSQGGKHYGECYQPCLGCE